MKKSPLKYKADPTLVQAAFAEGRSRVPIFDPNVTKAQASLVGNVMDPILGALGDLQKERDAEILKRKQEKDNYMNDLTKIMDASYKHLAAEDSGGDGGTLGDEVIGNYTAILEGIGQEYEDLFNEEETPEIKQKKYRLLSQAENVKNEIVELRASALSQAKAGSSSNDLKISPAANPGGDMTNTKIHGAITSSLGGQDMGRNMMGDPIVKHYSKDGERYFDVWVDGVKHTKSLKDYKKGLYTMNKGAESQLLGLGAEAETQGKGWKPGSGPYKLEGAINKIKDIIVDEATFADMAQRPMSIFDDHEGGFQTEGESNWEHESWANILETHPSLNKQVYDNLGIKVDTGDGKGGPPDGIISNEEAMALSPENRDLVIRCLVDPNFSYTNPDTGEEIKFNFALSKDLMAQDFGKVLFEKYTATQKVAEDLYNQKIENKNKKPITESGFVSPVKLGSYIKEKEWEDHWQPTIDNLNSDVSDIPVWNAPKGYGMRKVDGKYQMRGEGGKWVNTPKVTIAEQFDIIKETQKASTTTGKLAIGDSVKNPFPLDAKGMIVQPNLAKEGKYYLGHNDITYLFKGGKYTEVETGEKDISMFFGPKANEENAVSKLKILYPKLKISSPIGAREKIKVNGKMFYLRGKGDSTPEMEMRRLQKYIRSIGGSGKAMG